MGPVVSSKAAEIVACTRQLLATRGYEGFSYADIAEVVGISKPSIHHHFASKAVLVRTVVAAYRREALAGLQALEAGIADPVALLQAWTGWWQACVRDGSLPFCLCAMLASGMPAIPTEIGVEVRGHFDDLRTWLAAVLTRGAGSGRLALASSPEQEALAFIAALHGAMVAARAYDDPAVFHGITDSLVARLAIAS